MSYVGDVNAQKPVPAVPVLDQRHAVVEIAHVHGVDGDDGRAGEVLAAVEIFLIETVRRCPGFLEHVLGEGVGQTELADDGQGIDAGLSARSEYLRNDRLAAGILLRRKAQHLDDHLVVGPHATGAGVADVDAVAENRAVHADVSLAFALEVGPHELTGRPLQHLQDDPSGSDLAAALVAQLDQDLVARDRIESVVRADGDLGTCLAINQMGPHKAESGAGTPKGPGDGPQLAGEANGLVLADVQSSLANQFAQAAAKVAVLLLRDTQLAGQGLGFERRVRLSADGGQDLFGKVGHGPGSFSDAAMIGQSRNRPVSIVGMGKSVGTANQEPRLPKSGRLRKSQVP